MTYAKTLQEAKDGCKECLTVNDCVKEECRWHWIIKALEKQIPKKPKYVGEVPVCSCGMNLSKEEFSYCRYCGQAISWEGEE